MLQTTAIDHSSTPHFLYAVRHKSFLGLTICLSGCLSMATMPDYPPTDWAAVDTTMIGRCPDISGTYVNKSEIAHLFSGFDCSSRKPFNSSGSWSCSEYITNNFGIPGEINDVIKIKQPNDKSIIVTTLSDKQPIKHFELTRGPIAGDFVCSNDGLVFSNSGSLLPNALGVLGALTLQGGLISNTRAFRRTKDGALVMTVRENVHLWYVFFGGDSNVIAHIRWNTQNVPSRSN